MVKSLTRKVVTEVNVRVPKYVGEPCPRGYHLAFALDPANQVRGALPRTVLDFVPALISGINFLRNEIAEVTLGSTTGENMKVTCARVLSQTAHVLHVCRGKRHSVTAAVLDQIVLE